MHDLNSSHEASSNNTNGANSNMTNSSICSNSDSEAAKILQSSPSQVYSEEDSAELQTITAPEENSVEKGRSISCYGTSDDESPSPPALATVPSRYRNSGPHLRTIHMFTGAINGKRPIYVPVYKRNDDGKLLKLVKSRSGYWEYTELKELTEGETAEGLKISKEPKAEVVLQSSESKKAAGHRTLADLILPETKPKGG